MQIITKLIDQANKQKASDLHLVPGNYPALRVDNKIVYIEDESLIDVGLINEFIASLLDEQQKKILAEKKGIVVSHNFENDLRAKLHISFQKGLPSIYIRIIPRSIKSINELGLPEAVKSIINLSRGLVLVSGPFNSGRSSTVAAMINELSGKAKKYILTLEEPVEYIYEGKKSIIEQKEVGVDVVDYVSGLADLRERDLDVLFIDKFEEADVISEALDIAAGNALVISVLNSDSSQAAMEKIIFSFPQAERIGIQKQLAESLKAVIVQRLVPKIGGGQALAYEILIVNRAIELLISEGNLSQIDNILQTSRNEGMIGLDQKLAELVEAGEITRIEAQKNALSQEVLDSLL